MKRIMRGMKMVYVMRVLINKLFKSREQKILDSIVRCCECGTLGCEDNELIDISKGKYMIAICENCRKS